ncbi:hypothetical protein EDD22DRAFT_959052 [Suillus occidentalis]|nr:hypothetical protein EDD22DRAFT_959052 [Suillus occidentalis]
MTSIMERPSPTRCTINSEDESQKYLQANSGIPCHDMLLGATGSSNSRKDTTGDPIFVAPALPPVTRHMSCYIQRASPWFVGQGNRVNAPSALELHFARRFLGGDTDMSMIDVQKGKKILLNGIKDLPDEIIQDTVLAAQAECEHTHLVALASAWGLEEIERHPPSSKRFWSNCTRAQLEDDADFTMAAYVEDFVAFTVADSKLDHLEDAADARELNLPMDDATPELYVNSCLEAIIQDSGNHIYNWPY